MSAKQKTGNIVTMGGRTTSAHKDETLMARFELAKKFHDDFHAGGAILLEAYDRWGVEQGHLTPLPDNCGLDTPEWAKRLRERHALKSDINLGGRCDLFGEQQYQLVVEEHGKSYRITKLRDTVDARAVSIAERASQGLANQRRELERLINSIADLSPIERSDARQVIESVEDQEAVFATLADRHGAKMARLKHRLESRAQGVLPGLLDAPKEPSSDNNAGDDEAAA